MSAPPASTAAVHIPGAYNVPARHPGRACGGNPSVRERRAHPGLPVGPAGPPGRGRATPGRHAQLHVLEGGVNGWIAAGCPVRQGAKGGFARAAGPRGWLVRWQPRAAFSQCWSTRPSACSPPSSGAVLCSRASPTRARWACYWRSCRTTGRPAVTFGAAVPRAGGGPPAGRRKEARRDGYARLRAGSGGRHARWGSSAAAARS